MSPLYLSDSQNSCGSAQPSCPDSQYSGSRSRLPGKAPFPVANIRCNPAVLPDSPVPVPHTFTSYAITGFSSYRSFLICRVPNQTASTKSSGMPIKKHYAQPASSPKPFAPSPPFSPHTYAVLRACISLPVPLALLHLPICPFVLSYSLCGSTRASFFSFYTIFS